MSDIFRLIKAEYVKLFSKKITVIALSALVLAAMLVCTVFSVTMDKFDLDAQMLKLSEDYSKKISETQSDGKLTEEQKRSNIAKYEAYISGIDEMQRAGYTPYDWQGQIYLQIISVDAQIKYIRSDPVYFGEQADPERRAGAEGLIRVLEGKKDSFREMMEEDNWRLSVESQLEEADNSILKAEEKGETDKEAEITKEICELRLKYGIVPSYLTNALVSDFNLNLSGQFANEIVAAVKAMLGTDWHNDILEEIEKERKILAGLDKSEDGGMGGLSLGADNELLQEERARIEESVNEKLYRLENDISVSNGTVYGAVCMVLMEFLLSVAAICVIVMAGRIMSDEFIKGTVKFMLLTPYKRGKIWLAKYLTVLIFAVFAVVFACGITLITAGLYFGFEGIGGAVLADFGSGTLPFAVNLLICFLVNALPMLMTVTLAYMLSCLTRSSAASIGITVAYFFGSSIAITFISMLNPDLYKKVWLYNEMTVNVQNILSPESFVFANSELSLTVGHSAVTVIAFFVLINIISFLSFTKRDVKL